VTSGQAAGVQAGQSSSVLGIGSSVLLSPGAFSGNATLRFITEAQDGSGLQDEVVATHDVTVTGTVTVPAQLRGPATLDCGRIHVGGAFPVLGVLVENSQPVSAWIPYSERLAVTVETSEPGLWNNGATIASLAPGSADGTTILVRMTEEGTAGEWSKRLILSGKSLSPDGMLSDLDLPPHAVDVTGLVYTGKGSWNGGDGSYDDWSKWARLGGQPGVDGALSRDDTATFGGAGGNVVTLGGISPRLQALSFSSTAGTSLVDCRFRVYRVGRRGRAFRADSRQRRHPPATLGCRPSFRPQDLHAGWFKADI